MQQVINSKIITDRIYRLRILRKRQLETFGRVVRDLLAIAGAFFIIGFYALGLFG